VPYAVADASDFEGRRKQIREALGLTAFGINQYDSPPGHEGFRHDELDSGQEEVYVALAGAGVIRVDEDELDFTPGRYVFVPPDVSRQVVAGHEGLSYLVVGSRPGAYSPRGGWA
jgi:uncharacterized cupin superfamily protein